MVVRQRRVGGRGLEEACMCWCTYVSQQQPHAQTLPAGSSALEAWHARGQELELDHACPGAAAVVLTRGLLLLVNHANTARPASPTPAVPSASACAQATSPPPPPASPLLHVSLNHRPACLLARNLAPVQLKPSSASPRLCPEAHCTASQPPSSLRLALCCGQRPPQTRESSLRPVSRESVANSPSS